MNNLNSGELFESKVYDLAKEAEMLGIEVTSYIPYGFINMANYIVNKAVGNDLVDVVMPDDITYKDITGVFIGISKKGVSSGYYRKSFVEGELKISKIITTNYTFDKVTLIDSVLENIVYSGFKLSRVLKKYNSDISDTMDKETQTYLWTNYGDSKFINVYEEQLTDEDFLQDIVKKLVANYKKTGEDLTVMLGRKFSTRREIYFL